MSRRDRAARRRDHAAELRAVATGDPAEQELFNASFELAEAARRYAAVAGRRGSAAATAASLGCVRLALRAQADAALKTRSLALHVFSDAGELDEDGSGDAAELGRMLLAVDRNLRASAAACGLAHDTATQILEDRRRRGGKLDAWRRRVAR